VEAPVLVLEQLQRRFGEVVALDRLDLTVAAGELRGFVGPNGAGKTTAMRCAVGVTTPDAGTVTWEGRPVDLEVRRRIGYMPEERGLYPRMRVTSSWSTSPGSTACRPQRPPPTPPTGSSGSI
jgi:ABC-2 type transport system ATP-binding protein